MEILSISYSSGTIWLTVRRILTLCAVHVECILYTRPCEHYIATLQYYLHWQHGWVWVVEWWLHETIHEWFCTTTTHTYERDGLSFSWLGRHLSRQQDMWGKKHEDIMFSLLQKNENEDNWPWQFLRHRISFRYTTTNVAWYRNKQRNSMLVNRLGFRVNHYPYCHDCQVYMSFRSNLHCLAS